MKMKIKRTELYKILLFFLVVAPIYQDSPLSKYLGAAGYSLMMPISLIAVSAYALLKTKVPFNRQLNELIRLGIWMVLVSYGAIVIWIILGKEISLVGEFLPYKALKVCLQYFSFPAYIMLVLICARRAGSVYIGKYAFWTLLILTIICLLERKQLPYAFQKMHFAGTFPYYRIRLLTLESSWTAVMIYVYSAISLYWCLEYRKRIGTIISVICVVFLITYTGSKTLMLSIAISIVIYLVIVIRKLTARRFVCICLVALAMFIFAYTILPQLIASLNADISNYTSVATRLYTSVLGLLIGIFFPVGVGGAVYLGVYKYALAEFLPIFQRLPFKLNMTEIMSLVSKTTDEALTVKSGVFHHNMYWGILGTIYLMRNFARMTSNIAKSSIGHKELLITSFWSTVILLVASNFCFEFWLLYVFLLYVAEENRVA